MHYLERVTYYLANVLSGIHFFDEHIIIQHCLMESKIMRDMKLGYVSLGMG